MEQRHLSSRKWDVQDTLQSPPTAGSSAAQHNSVPAQFSVYPAASAIQHAHPGRCIQQDMTSTGSAVPYQAQVIHVLPTQGMGQLAAGCAPPAVHYCSCTVPAVSVPPFIVPCRPTGPDAEPSIIIAIPDAPEGAPSLGS